MQLAYKNHVLPPTTLKGYGMVERFNRTLIQLLKTYMESQEEWETYLSCFICI